MSNYGHFEGEVITRWLKDGDGKDRTMELLEDFSYVDQYGDRWLAAKGSRIDGASIPTEFWSNTIGSPYVGDYRRATVIHDVYCKDESKPYRQVHRMFYEAMLCDGVPLLKAVTMFKAVDLFGPKWGPGISYAPTPAMDSNDVVNLEAATRQAIEELGEEADLDALNLRIDEILRESP